VGRDEFTSDAKVEFADTTGAVYRQGCASAVGAASEVRHRDGRVRHRDGRDVSIIIKERSVRPHSSSLKSLLVLPFKPLLNKLHHPLACVEPVPRLHTWQPQHSNCERPVIFTRILNQLYRNSHLPQCTIHFARLPGGGQSRHRFLVAIENGSSGMWRLRPGGLCFHASFKVFPRFAERNQRSYQESFSVPYSLN